LFTFAGGSGHAYPLLPIADAVRAAGHTVAFASGMSTTPEVDARGFTMLGKSVIASDAPQSIAPLVELEIERQYGVLRDHFAGRWARFQATRVVELSAEWQPDLIVCDEVDFGSMIAAERLGLPHATVLVIAAGSFIRPDVVADALDTLRAEHGLPPDPGLEMLSRHLVLSPFPPSFRDPAYPLPLNALSLRLEAAGPADAGGTPPWLADLPDRPTVYFTLGTVFNTESGDLFSRVLTGLRELPINVIVTVGRQIDPGSFGPQPDNVRIERFVPQAALLPHCDLVVNHGGSGSVIGALAHGLPLVVIPMGADQSLNAARCEQLGVGIALDAVQATPRSVRDAVALVLENASYRVAAERIRDEIAALPGADAAVPLLERLVAGAGSQRIWNG
jgi:UDP:flavonoid glycosyltransferase YjiC (YdhE family)